MTRLITPAFYMCTVLAACQAKPVDFTATPMRSMLAIGHSSSEVEDSGVSLTADSTGFDLELGCAVGGPVELGIEAGLVRTEFDLEGSGDDFATSDQAFSLLGKVRLYLLRTEEVRPWFEAGVGVATVSSDFADSTGSDRTSGNGFAYVAGGGLSIYTSEWSSIELGVRYAGASFDIEDIEVRKAGVQARVGFALHW